MSTSIGQKNPLCELTSWCIVPFVASCWLAMILALIESFLEVASYLKLIASFFICPFGKLLDLHHCVAWLSLVLIPHFCVKSMKWCPNEHWMEWWNGREVIIYLIGVLVINLHCCLEVDVVSCWTMVDKLQSATHIYQMRAITVSTNIIPTSSFYFRTTNAQAPSCLVFQNRFS